MVIAITSDRIDVIEKIKLNKEKMYELSLKGHTTATDLADWMVKNLKISFQLRYRI